MYKITVYRKIGDWAEVIKDFVILEPPPPDNILRELVKECGGDFFDICRTDDDTYLYAKWEQEKRRARDFFNTGQV